MWKNSGEFPTVFGSPRARSDTQRLSVHRNHFLGEQTMEDTELASTCDLSRPAAARA